MRIAILIVAVFSSGVALAGDYSEVREFAVDAGGATRLVIDAGQGSLRVRGEPGIDQVSVAATITVPDASESKARKSIERNLRLSLERGGDTVRLDSYFDQRLWSKEGWIDLEVRMPSAMALRVDDGSGSIDIADIDGDIDIDDGSGSIDISNVGNVDIDDGSGSIVVTGSRGDVFVEDGSGSIDVRRIEGSVTIDDGSGGIRVGDVSGDLVVIDAGSGGLDFDNVRGRIEVED